MVFGPWSVVLGLWSVVRGSWFFELIVVLRTRNQTLPTRACLSQIAKIHVHACSWFVVFGGALLPTFILRWEVATMLFVASGAGAGLGSF